MLGTSVTVLALPTLAILKLHAGPFQVGLLAALPRLPFAVLSLPAGAWIDRFRRRPVMIACDLARLVVLGSIPVAAVLGELSLVQLYVVAVVLGIFTVFFDIAYLAYFPALVGDEDLLEGNQKLEVSYSLANLLGPGLAGILITAFGAAKAMLADAFSYLGSALALLWIRVPEPVPQPSGATFRQDLAEGLRFTLGNSVLGTMLLGMVGLIFGAHVAETVTFVYAYGPLRLTPALLGAIITTAGVGSIVGAVTSGPVARRVGTGRTVALTGIVSGLVFGLTPLAQVLPAVPTLVALMLAGFYVNPINNVTQVSLRQRLTPDRLRGRMNAIFRLVYWTAWPLGNLAGGVLGARVGLVPTFAIGGAITVLGSGAMLLTPIGRYRD